MVYLCRSRIFGDIWPQTKYAMTLNTLKRVAHLDMLLSRALQRYAKIFVRGNCADAVPRKEQPR